MANQRGARRLEPVPNRIVLAGIGRDGSSIVHGLDGLPGVVHRMFLTGSPTSAIAGSPDLLRVRGSENWRSELRAALAGAQMLVTVAAVTGKEESFTPDVLGVARSEGALSVAVLVEPLLANSPHKTDTTARLTRDVTRSADATILVPAAPHAASLSLSEAIRNWTRSLSAAALGLLNAAAAEDVMGVEFSDLAAVLSSHCRATVCVGHGRTVDTALSDAVKNSLAPAAELETARSVLAHVTGGGDMPLDEARRAIPVLEYLFPKADIRCGVSVGQGVRGIRATLVVGKLDVTGLRSTEGKRTAQVESPFFKVGDPTVYDGEHLDTPAFVRNDVTLPGGPPRPVPAQKTLFDGPSPSRA